MYGPSKLQLALSVGALFGNHYYHHSHKVKIQLGLESMPEVPSIKNDPPGFSFDSNFESGVDTAVNDMERHTNELPSQTVFQNYEYRGDYVLENKETIPHEAGTYEMGHSKVVGAFDHGNLKGPFKLSSREDDIVVKSVLDQDKMNGLIVTYSKGCKFEMDMATRNYILTDQFDNKAYVQAMPGDFRYTKFYNKDGRKMYTEYKNSQDNGIRETFEEDGSKLTVEMRNGQPEGQSIYRDKYGDLIYTGIHRNGEVTKRWSLYTEIGAIFGICLLSTFYPRNPKRTISKMRNSWFGLFKSKRIGSY